MAVALAVVALVAAGAVFVVLETSATSTHPAAPVGGFAPRGDHDNGFDRPADDHDDDRGRPDPASTPGRSPPSATP